MKFLIASDIHGSAYYCEQLLQAFEREQAARLLLLGDILYHGPRNNLPRDYAPKKVIAMLNGMADMILCVRGNCDTEVDQMVLAFPILADYAVLPAGERLVYVTHGHIFNTQTPPPLRKGESLQATVAAVYECYGLACKLTVRDSRAIPRVGEGELPPTDVHDALPGMEGVTEPPRPDSTPRSGLQERSL